LDDDVTLTTLIVKVPEVEAEQPDGAEAWGATAEVTPCGIGLARAAPARVRATMELFIADIEWSASWEAIVRSRDALQGNEGLG
jgi:hypothetical protein